MQVKLKGDFIFLCTFFTIDTLFSHLETQNSRLYTVKVFLSRKNQKQRSKTMDFTNQTRKSEHAQIVASYTHYVSEIKNPTEWVKQFFTPDATFVIGNSPISAGHDQIADGASRIYALASGVNHVVTSVIFVEMDPILTSF